MQVQQFKRLAQMADKVFDRAFNKALEVQKREEEKAQARRPPTQQEIEAAEQKALREEAMPMSTRDAIKRMMLADKDKDYFRQVVPTVQLRGMVPLHTLPDFTAQYTACDVINALLSVRNRMYLQCRGELGKT